MDPHARSRRLPAVVAAGLVTATCLVTQWNIDGNRRIDYRIYTRAVASSGEGGLYEYGTGILRFTYPPVAALLVRPFSTLDESVGSRVWLVLSVVAFVVAFALVVRHAGGRRTVPWHLAVLGGSGAVWLAPALSTLRLGQINAFVALLLCIDAVQIGRRSRWAGAATGVAAAVKVTPLALLPVLWAARAAGGRRAATTAAAVTGAITAATAVVAPDTLAAFVRVLSGRATERSGPSVDLRIIVRSVVPNSAVADAAWLIGSVLLLVLAARTAARLARPQAVADADADADTNGGVDGIGLVTVGMCLSTVVSPFSSAHHLTFAIAACILWAARATTTWERAVAAIGFVVLLDPTAGEAIVARWGMVGFCIVTLAALPRAISPAERPSPKMCVGREEDTDDVRSDTAATR